MLNAALEQVTGFKAVSQDHLADIHARYHQKNAHSINVMSITLFHLKKSDGTLYIAMEDPGNLTLTDDIGFIVNMPIQFFICDIDILKSMIEKYHGNQMANLDSLIASGGVDVEDVDEVANANDIGEAAESKPVINLSKCHFKDGH